MNPTVLAEIEQLCNATTAQLRQRYRELFGEDPGCVRKPRLFRRLAWRLQALADGTLSEPARQHALAIAQDADLRIQPPPEFLEQIETSLGTSWSNPVRPDRRVPPPGTVLTRRFRDRTILVKVLPSGFEYEGQRYRSLSAIACHVTGTRWNGLLFFGLTDRKTQTAREDTHAQ
jgi:Protein of unknown function (DUF2924)